MLTVVKSRKLEDIPNFQDLLKLNYYIFSRNIPELLYKLFTGHLRRVRIIPDKKVMERYCKWYFLSDNYWIPISKKQVKMIFYSKLNEIEDYIRVHGKPDEELDEPMSVDEILNDLKSDNVKKDIYYETAEQFSLCEKSMERYDEEPFTIKPTYKFYKFNYNYKFEVAPHPIPDLSPLDKLAHNITIKYSDDSDDSDSGFDLFG